MVMRRKKVFWSSTTESFLALKTFPPVSFKFGLFLSSTFDRALENLVRMLSMIAAQKERITLKFENLEK